MQFKEAVRATFVVADEKLTTHRPIKRYADGRHCFRAEYGVQHAQITSISTFYTIRCLLVFV
jgi:hypothetical protein